MDCVYYTDAVRCYKNGLVERYWRNKYWQIVENTDNNDGYNQIEINGRKIKRQRLLAYCFLGLNDIVGKKNNDDCIDHIDNNRLNNSVANLRITTNQGNQHNRSKTKGYYWNNKNNKYLAKIILNGKSIHLGYYDTEEEARQAYLRAKVKYHIPINTSS